MKFVKETALNNRPHPGPLPQERENLSPASCIAPSSCLSLFIQPEEPTNGGAQQTFKLFKPRDCCSLSPG